MHLTVKLDQIINGGQAIGTLAGTDMPEKYDGKKALVWGGLPGETVEFRVTKKKSKFVEGVVTSVITPSSERIAPTEPSSYLSTSPWQIMEFTAEQHYKAALIEEAFELHRVSLPNPIEIYSDEKLYGYRNKLEFSWYSEHDEITGEDTLDLAFFRRASKSKIIVEGSELAHPSINKLAIAVRDLLRQKGVSARNLKTLLIRANQKGQCRWQLYLKDKLPKLINEAEAASLPAIGGDVIYSDPRSPASVATERLATFGEKSLSDTILDIDFRYATEGFFQINLPVYEKTLGDMREWVNSNPASQDNKPQVVDLYAGVGSIGLTIGGHSPTLVEVNEHAVKEMRQNIKKLGIDATAVLAPSEKSLDYITTDKTIIVDPPRAGLHQKVIDRLLETTPQRIVYLSCNPVTQARDTALLTKKYGIRHHQGYNFFPRTPHIEHLIILDLKT